MGRADHARESITILGLTLSSPSPPPQHPSYFFPRVGTQDGIIVVATSNDPTSLDPAILKRPGRFDRVVQFRNPNADLRRHYYQRLSPILAGEQFEIAIRRTEGFSFAQLRETYILGAQSAFENGSEVGVADVIEAIELQAAGAQDLKTSVAAPGFVRHTEPSASST